MAVLVHDLKKSYGYFVPQVITWFPVFGSKLPLKTYLHLWERSRAKPKVRLYATSLKARILKANPILDKSFLKINFSQKNTTSLKDLK